MILKKGVIVVDASITVNPFSPKGALTYVVGIGRKRGKRKSVKEKKGKK
ncbi:MAG: hypothetical protein ACMUEL_05415 [Flavobacteriales bacterium Tduv]